MDDAQNAPLDETDFEFLDYLVKSAIESIIPSAKSSYALSKIRVDVWFRDTDA